MAADYAGACLAIRTRFTDGWKVADVPITPVDYVNKSSPEPPTDPVSNKPVPCWVFFEIVHNGSYIVGSGTPGQQTIVYDGLIKGHVFTPINSGEEDGLAKAVAIGEMFRNKLFYNDVTPGCYVRAGYDKNGQPRIDAGDMASDDGQWFTTTATIPFEYWHLG
jgi:hypothetical protein